MIRSVRRSVITALAVLVGSVIGIGASASFNQLYGKDSGDVCYGGSLFPCNHYCIAICSTGTCECDTDPVGEVYSGGELIGCLYQAHCTCTDCPDQNAGPSCTDPLPPSGECPNSQFEEG